jgi:hypothetical protein
MKYGIVSHCFETTKSVVHKSRYKVVRCDHEIDNYLWVNILVHLVESCKWKNRIVFLDGECKLEQFKIGRWGIFNNIIFAM